FLWDGTNANVLYDMLAAGEAPNLARLLDAGTGLAHGAMASLPSVTLANHTTILTGAHPGHHGVLHNAWYDRVEGRQIITNSPETWPWSMRSLSPAVETLHQAIHRAFPGSRTVSVNEPCDVGADDSTFEVLRTGGRLAHPPKPEDLPFATEPFVRPDKAYAISSQPDHLGLVQALDVTAGARAGRPAGGRAGAGAPPPRSAFVTCTLPAAAVPPSGPHGGMPRASRRGRDARLGRTLHAAARAGVWARAACVLVADPGMEGSNPEGSG